MGGDFCVCVFAGIFFFCVVEVVLSLFLFLSWVLAASSQAPRLELPDTVIQYLSYFFSPLAIHLLLPARPRAILKLSHATFLGSLVFFFYFSGEREREQVWHFLVQANLQLLHVSAFKKSVTLIALISERLMCLWASDKLKEPPLMRAGMSKFRANLAFRDLTFLALSNRTSFPLLV